MNIKELLMTRNTIRVSIAFVSTLSHLRGVVCSAFVPKSELPPLAFIGQNKNGCKNNRNLLLALPFGLRSQKLVSYLQISLWSLRVGMVERCKVIGCKWVCWKYENRFVTKKKKGTGAAGKSAQKKPRRAQWRNQSVKFRLALPGLCGEGGTARLGMAKGVTCFIWPLKNFNRWWDQLSFSAI